MLDVAQRQGMKVDAEALASALNIPVVPMVATKNQGLKELMDVITEEASKPVNSRRVKHIEADSEVKNTISRIEGLITDETTTPYPRHWAATKLLEGDSQISKLVRERLSQKQLSELDSFLRDQETCAITIATLRYEWVRKMVAQCQEKPPLGQVSLTERLDRVATHPILGVIVLVAIMALVFWLVYSIGIPIRDFLDSHLVQAGRELIFAHSMPGWLQGFLADGVLGGAGTVLTFVPILFLFFFVWGFLEDVGYTTRVAFVADRFMHLLGLHGKSVLPLVLGFGCNVPAVMGARIIESERARLLTVLLAPLVPCTGRMAVVALIAAAFFGSQATLVSLGIILFSILMLIVSGIIMNRFIVSGERAAFIMELPLYHVPHLRSIGLMSWQRTVAFMKRAGTIILIAAIVVWLLSSFPGDSIDESFLAQIGRGLEPVGRLMGLNWQMMVALLSSFVAKENTIATLGVLFGGGGAGLTEALKGVLTSGSALAFLVLQVLFVPCAATVAVIRQETRSWAWTTFSIGFQLVLSFGMAILIFQIAQLIIH
jgi:ferrous iron transport protein B